MEYLENPRAEAAENDLHVDNRCFLELGLEPTTLENGLLTEVLDIAKRYKDRCDREKILCRSYWNSSVRARTGADKMEAVGRQGAEAMAASPSASFLANKAKI